MPFLHRGVEGGEPRHVHVVAAEVDLLEGGVVIDHAFAGGGQDLEFVTHVAADRTALGNHGDRHEPHALEGAEIGDEHGLIGALGALIVIVEGIGVLHQELAPAHHPEARADLVAELPLDVEQVERQLAVALHVAAEDVHHVLLVGGAVEHLAIMAVADAQHLLAVGLVAAALLPPARRLDGGHEDLDGAGPLHLLAADLLHLLEDAKAQRQPVVDSRRRLLDHAGPQHQPVGDDLRLRRILLQDRHEVPRHAHGFRHSPPQGWTPGRNLGPWAEAGNGPGRRAEKSGRARPAEVFVRGGIRRSPTPDPSG